MEPLANTTVSFPSLALAFDAILALGGEEVLDSFATLDDGRVVVEVTEADAARLIALNDQRGWDCRRHSGAIPPMHRAADAIGVTLARVDVNGRAMAGTSPPWTEYLLGSTTAENAQETLRALLDSGTGLVRVRPLQLPAGPALDFHPRLFWHVVDGPPLRAALECADRVYWGPVSETPNGGRVYVQWPYEPTVSAEHLARVSWGDEGGLVLLSRESPIVLAVRVPAQSEPFAELTTVADLHLRNEPAVVATATAQVETPFRVCVRLAAAPRSRQPAERLAQLRREIAYRQQLVRRWEDEGRRESAERPIFEPVYLYLAEKGRIPDELRRLLIEWCDQQEFRGLWYAKLDPAVLPLHDLARGREVHVLVTDAALRGRPAPGGEQLWLRDFAPTDGFAFRVLPEWLPHGLRLAIPDGPERLVLYPELHSDRAPEYRAGAVAAQKLAEALIPAASGLAARDALVLLLSGGTAVNRFHDPASLPIPARLFRPLVSALPWECAVEALPPPSAVRHLPDLTQSVGDAFRGAIRDASGEPVRRLVQEVTDTVAALHTEAANRVQVAQEQVDELRTAIGTREAAIRELAGRLAALETEAANATAQVSNADERFRRFQNLLGAAEALFGEIATFPYQLEEQGRIARQLQHAMSALRPAAPRAPVPDPPEGDS